MSNYTQVTSFTPKDALVTGNPLKLIKGADLDAELGAISTAIATKYDASNVNSAPVGFADGTFALPGITFAADTNTGIYRVASDSIGVTTGGVLRLGVNATGNVTIAGTTGSNMPLQVSADATSANVLKLTDSAGNNPVIASLTTGGLFTLTTSATANSVRFTLGATNVLTLATSGSVMVGTSGATTLTVQTAGIGDTALNLLGNVANGHAIMSLQNALGAGQTAVVALSSGSATNNPISGAAAGDLCLRTSGSNGLKFSGDAGTTTHLAIATGTPSIQFRGPNIGALVDMTPDRGTFTGTLTGMTAGTTGTVNWVRMGNIAILYITAGITGTSNTTAMTMTGLPAAITPTQTQSCFGASFEDNTVGSKWGVSSVAATGVITFSLSTGATYSTAGFTAAGVKGITTAWQIVYSLA